MEFAISWLQMVRLSRNVKQTYRLNSKPQMGPSGLTLAMTLTLNFQGQIRNLLYRSEKWSDCLETKNKLIDWTPGLKCDHDLQGFLFTQIIGHSPIKILKVLNIFKLQDNMYVCFCEFYMPLVQLRSKCPVAKLGRQHGPWKVRCKDLTHSDRGDF